jgi:AbrB family looped-hinge helix DNA binding protein
MDANGRLVLPKSIRERLNLTSGIQLEARVIGGHIELTPVDAEEATRLVRKRGILVIKGEGVARNAGVAVAAERDSMEERGTRR